MYSYNNAKNVSAWGLILIIVTLAGCGGGGSGSEKVPDAVTVSVTATQPKALTFSWDDVGADHYKLLKNPDGVSGYTQVGDNINATTVDETIPVFLQDWVNASYIVQACNKADVCADSEAMTATSLMLNTIGYFKASNTNSNDQFGFSVALSADGSTLAVGALGESSLAAGINADQSDNSALYAGAVYVFTRNGSSWSQQAYIKSSNPDSGDQFGRSVALSSDGNTMVVGAKGEASVATGVNGNQADNSVSSAGAVYVFTRNSDSWSQQAYIKASNTNAGDQFGYRVALSADGNTLAVGADQESSAATGINGNQDDNSESSSGAVYVFVRNDSHWNQQAYIKQSNTGWSDRFGSSLAISADGNTLAVGAISEDSAATGINGDQADDSTSYAGAVYVFTRSASTWSQQAYVKASNTDRDDWFGNSVALSGDGNTLAVGANYEESSATGINGVQADNNGGASGAVYVFTRSNNSWSQQAYVKASNTDLYDGFGISVTLSGNGDDLAVGAWGEASVAMGINGDQVDNSVQFAGAVYMFTRIGSDWSQQAYIKASNTDPDDLFGRSVSLSSNGHTLAVGANSERSLATGINGDQNDNSADNAGAVYLY